MQIFKEKDTFRMAISPEGTEKKWSMENRFYYIAKSRCTYFIHLNSSKKVSFLKLFTPNGEVDENLKEIKANFYKAEQV